MSRIPDRWCAYSAIGKPIPGTRFICFKAPLKDALCRNLEEQERFTPEMLMEKCPNLGLVVDLTNTGRYYDGQVFVSNGIEYKKIHCPGKIIPSRHIVRTFFNIVDAFLRDSNGKDTLIGVHCTHGLNRTGYFVCRYLNLRMGFEPQNAIAAFEDARGYKMERQPYIRDIVAAEALDDNGAPRNFESRPGSRSPTRNNTSFSDDNYHSVHPANNDFVYYNAYPQQAPLPYAQNRQNGLDYVSPLADSSYNTVPSRYSRGYGYSSGSRDQYRQRCPDRDSRRNAMPYQTRPDHRGISRRDNNEFDRHDDRRNGRSRRSDNRRDQVMQK